MMNRTRRHAHTSTTVIMGLSKDTMDIIRELGASRIWAYEEGSHEVNYYLNWVLEPEFEEDINKYVVFANNKLKYVYGQAGLEYGVTYEYPNEPTRMPNVFYTKEWAEEVLDVIDTINNTFFEYGFDFGDDEAYEATDLVIEAICKGEPRVWVNGVYIRFEEISEKYM